MRTFRKYATLFAICLIASLLFCENTDAKAPKIKGKVVRVIPNRIQGKVSAVMGNFIAIVYSRDMEKGSEEEMTFTIDNDFQVLHKRGLHEIQVGDTVEVRYEDTMEEYDEEKPDGEFERKSKIVKRRARIINFIKPARQGLYSGEEESF